jgi:hypothetical protein
VKEAGEGSTIAQGAKDRRFALLAKQVEHGPSLVYRRRTADCRTYWPTTSAM